MKILFVSHNNDCTSPLAVGILKEKLRQTHKTAIIDSAGFEPHLIGDGAGQDIIKYASEKGIDISGHVIRLFSAQDFDNFDKIYVTDYRTLKDVKFYARNENDKKKVDYLMNVLLPGHNKAVPYPHGRNQEDFDATFNLIDKACKKIADTID
ncbi:MAG: low molecular weight phosphotyrosine protein phosphatase [Bacteroidetes bacterium]|nr:low molecular weight phosphotyrosine protein phosphatase [Bacteroidota bacterium]